MAGRPPRPDDLMAAAALTRSLAARTASLGVTAALQQAYALRRLAEAAIWGPPPAPPPDRRVQHRYRVRYEPPLPGGERNG
jgi:hypothetical protein